MVRDGAAVAAVAAVDEDEAILTREVDDVEVRVQGKPKRTTSSKVLYDHFSGDLFL
jgi:hypothetical protein